MPNKVAVNVKNCATTKRTLDAISWSDEMARETKESTTATMNEATAMLFSMYRLSFTIFYITSAVATTNDGVAVHFSMRRLSVNL